jgi:hypothetical protein
MAIKRDKRFCSKPNIFYKGQIVSAMELTSMKLDKKLAKLLGLTQGQLRIKISEAMDNYAPNSNTICS